METLDEGVGEAEAEEVELREVQCRQEGGHCPRNPLSKKGCDFAHE